jgi:uncharacterized membrane protein
MTLTILFFVGLSLLLIGLSIPMIRGRVKPNAWYGLRVSYTQDNPDVWYPANRYAGKLLLAYGLMLLLVTLGLPFLMDIDLTGPVTDTYVSIVTMVIMMGILVILALSWGYARKLATEDSAGEGS